MDELRRQNYLRMMGVTQWRLRQADSEAIPQPVVEAEAEVTLAEQPAPAGDVFEPTKSVNVSGDRSDWLTLREQVQACRQCGLRAGCSQTVFGVGNEQADLLIIGEAPGADEDRQGEPFVGRAGQLLNAMLLAMGFKREAVFIANIVKCRPPDNRDPAAEEASACQDYLLRQIALIQPKLILSVGRVSAQNLLETDIAVGKLRGRVHSFGGTNIPLVVTYHPAYLLRSPEQKGKAWQDLQLALSVLGSVSRDQGQA
ncbi:MAG: uracil-DNA glycosylase [Candidatus Thiodiazotropha sp. (ex Ctena orbiculata)]|nr:uracil-DNA glycosylase [Candidatus Thiodiazotropha taylori]